MQSASKPQADPRQVALVISDVDGTLVDKEKNITPATRAAVDALRAAGIRFTIISSRPPRGEKYIIEALDIIEPIAAVNGGTIITPEFKVLHESCLPEPLAVQTIEIMTAHGVDVWVFNGGSWFVTDRHGPHVDRETHTVRFEPLVVDSFEGKLDKIGKIVGVTDDSPRIQKCEAAIHAALGEHVAASCSQKYYLDVTHPEANKGRGIQLLSELLRVPTERICTIGDGANDVLMFNVSGYSVAMGNGAAEVQQAACAVTTPNTEDGFANAMRKFILGPRGAAIPAPAVRA